MAQRTANPTPMNETIILTVMHDQKLNGNGKIAVKTSRIQGRGVFAAKRIRKGERIIEYLGEKITHDEADRRYDDEKMDRHHTFLFELDDQYCIDAGAWGNSAKYINHSCTPNCEAVNEDGRIVIYSLRNIQPGVELTYDYAFEFDETLPETLRSLYVCHCGSGDCRGSILKPKKRRRKSRSRKRKTTRN